MPIYEYRREDGTTFELQQRFTDDALTVDPETGQRVERVLSAPAVHFKGSGFYSTDYGSRKRKRELDKSAEEGANNHDDKMKAKRDEAKTSSSDSSTSTAASTSSSKPSSD